MTKIKTASDFKAAQKKLGMTNQKLSDALRFKDVSAVEKIRSGKNAVTGQVELLMNIFIEYPEVLRRFDRNA